MILRLLAPAVLALAAGPAVRADEAPLQPRVVVVALFEVGADSGDRPGELQFWVEREKLDRVIPLPAAFHDVRANADGSVIALAAGVGNTNAGQSIMALGLDPRFDLRKSYWLVAGIAGIDPADAPIGSAVWADYVVDGDLAYEIDAREIPADWDTGYVPLGHHRPYQQPRRDRDYTPGQSFQLNPALVAWAYALTRDTPLVDDDTMRARRASYTAHEPARRAPFVLVGANLATSTYWHGALLNRWANAWTRYHTDGAANYVTTAMEDSAVLRALDNLERAGRADRQRALVLRAASNYDSPPPGLTAAESLAGEKIETYSGYIPSLEAAHRVGRRVVHALVEGWEKFEHTPPAATRP